MSTTQSGSGWRNITSSMSNSNEDFRCQDRREYQRNWQRKNKHKRIPFRDAFNGLRLRAKNANKDFNLELKDLMVPDVCPVLGIPIYIGGGMANRANSPSVDRIDNLKGYTKDNIRIVSHRANRLKSDMTLEECKLLLKDFEQFDTG